MWLRLLTTALIIFGLGLMFFSGWIVGQRPALGAPRAVKINYLRRSAVYVGLEAGTLIGAVVCAYIVARRARAEYLAQAEENLTALIEGALRDHKKPTDEES